MRRPKIERKLGYFPQPGSEIKVINKQLGLAAGYLHTLGNCSIIEGQLWDRTRPGCFEKTIRDAYARRAKHQFTYLWPFVLNNDLGQALGGILDASEDAIGLYVKVQYHLDEDLGRLVFARLSTAEQYTLVYRGMRVARVEEDGRSLRNLLEVAVMAASLVVPITSPPSASAATMAYHR